MVEAQFKKRMINIILNLITKAHNDKKFINKERLIGEFGLKEGISRRKMMEYISDLESAGIIEIMYGEIYLKNPPSKDPIEEEANKILKGLFEIGNVDV